MRRKLYIINNGMKDLRGHYFETSVSIAEASHSLGLEPILAAHVTCPSDIIPDGLEFHAAFTTDHWMIEPPPPQPDIGGLRCDPVLLASNSIEDLIDGKIGFKRYLEARYHRDPATPGGETTKLELAAPAFSGRRARIKHLVKSMIPPEILRAVTLSSDFLRQLIPTFAWNRVKGPVAIPAGCETHEVPAPPPRSKLLLATTGRPQEYDYSIRFRHDLERLLCLTGCTAADHVFLPTAHGRELCAILELLSSWPPESRPTFHLEFRHSLALAGDGVLTEKNEYCAANATFFEIARIFPVTKSVRLYTDSHGLSEEYERFSGLPFGVLPIPFRTHLLGNRSRRDGPLCLGYFGDVRDEKGFHWLPDLVEAMMEDHVQRGRVRFLIQASLVHPDHEPLSKRALEQLKSYPEDMVRLVGLDGPLSPDRYFQLVTESDLLLCPYHPATYRNRTSGTLTEAIASGIPTVVPHGSWLASQQPAGSGTTFLDRESFIEAVRKICDDYSSFQSRAKAAQYSWLALHSPEQVVRTLLGETVITKASSDGKVA